MKNLFFYALITCVSPLTAISQSVTASFDVEEVVCIDEPIVIKNTSLGASTYEWNFCAIDLKKPEIQNLDLGSVLNEPVYMDYVYTNGIYYAFVVNYKSGDLVRLKFGDNLLNTPEVHNFGNFSNVIPGNSGAAGLQIVENEGKWYIIMVAGYPPGGSNPRILRLSFGNSIENLQPAATDWGNLGNMYDPKDFVLLNENGNWYGFTVNSESNSITRFNFGTSFDNPPTATNLGNIGNLNFPTGIFVQKDAGVTHMYITNGGDDTRISGYYRIVRLDFGSLLDESPDIADVGNVGNLLQHPRDLHILTLCDNIYGLVLNAHPFYNTFLHLNFLGSYVNHPNGSVSPSNQLFTFPYSFSEFTTINDQIIGFVVNKESNSIARVVFKDCANSSTLISKEKDPPPVTYNAPGMYTIRLTVNKGMETEASYCRQIVTQDCREEVLITSDTTICSNTSIRMQAAQGVSYEWTPATYLDKPFSRSPVSKPLQTIKYYVDVVMDDNSIKHDSITITVLPSPVVMSTPDTIVCGAVPLQLNATGGITYNWTPATGLNDPSLPNPIATPAGDTRYIVTVIGNNNCFTQDTLNISVRKYPEFKASGNTSVCNGEPIQLTASGGDIYLWSPQNMVEDPASASTTAKPVTSTVFQVNISDNTCNYDTVIDVSVRIYSNGDADAFSLPNAFTPNGDGRNDCFGLKHWGDLEVQQFTIFNRWGQAVFSSKHTGGCWDGRINGIMQPSGTYLYLINANTPCGFIKRKGMVTLIR